MTPDEESATAVELRDKLKALIEKYGKYEHLAPFTSDLENIAEELDAAIEDTDDVE